MEWQDTDRICGALNLFPHLDWKPFEGRAGSSSHAPQTQGPNPGGASQGPGCRVDFWDTGFRGAWGHSLVVTEESRVASFESDGPRFKSHS